MGWEFMIDKTMTRAEQRKEYLKFRKELVPLHRAVLDLAYAGYDNYGIGLLLGHEDDYTNDRGQDAVAIAMDKFVAAQKAEKIAA